VAEQGECVIVGHAAQVILRGRLDTVRVLVTGSKEFRVRRIMAGMGVDEKGAIKTVERTDNERNDFFRRFYDTGWLLPCTYDLCVNTDHINPRQAADVLASAAASR
jgi:cytidylate kinase